MKQTNQDLLKSAECLRLIEHYKALLDELTLLGNSIKADVLSGLPCWVQTTHSDEHAPHTERAISILQNVTYPKDMISGDGRRVETRFGLVAASDYTIEKVIRVNQVKESLKQGFKTLKNLDGMSRDNYNFVTDKISESMTRSPIVRQALARAGLQKVHIKQSTRTIPLLDEQPLRIAFTHTTGSHSVRKITGREAKAMADNHSHKLANSLSGLDDNMTVYWYRKLAAHVRANLTYTDRQKLESRPDQVGGYLPIFYPYNVNKDPVIHNGQKVEALLSLDITDQRLPRTNYKVDLANPISEKLGLYPAL